MTKQEIFTTVKNHLLTQNAKSYSPGDGCMYRGPEGRKCALGCLIPDDKYCSDMEGMNINAPGVRNMLPFEVGDGDLYDLLDELQFLHDCRIVEEWPSRLRTLAQEKGLTYEP